MEWSLTETKLILHHPKGDLYWVMPAGFSMPSRAILSLAEYVLLTPYGEKIEVLESGSAPGNRTAVAFSGGVDSAAVLQLVENPVAIYTRVADPSGKHKLENALLAVDEVGGMAVETNQDMLPKWHEMSRGFYGTAGWTTTSILLAEHLGIGTIADGNIIDFVYLRTDHGDGTKYNRPDFSTMQKNFARVGMHYGIPCAGLSEISTTKIAAKYRYTMGCMRGEGGQPCRNCMKCYRKLALQGTLIPTNKQVEIILEREWIPVLGTLLWARDHRGLSHPVLDPIERDYSWVDKWYPQSIEMMPEHLRPYFLARLQAFGIEKLEDDSSLLNWDARAIEPVPSHRGFKSSLRSWVGRRGLRDSKRV
ncbi:DUF6395 domain-containing protein [Demequina aurantiaca]|uniref:DUF6395 domain-containing protein n=1 Tax=Demequina aurantiaca TaxID=676200 RepID=UPI003D3535D2